MRYLLRFSAAASMAMFAFPAFAQNELKESGSDTVSVYELCQFFSASVGDWVQTFRCSHGSLKRVPVVLEPASTPKPGSIKTAAIGDEIYREELRILLGSAKLNAELSIEDRRMSKTFSQLAVWDEFLLGEKQVYCSINQSPPSEEDKRKARVGTVLGQPLFEATCLADENQDGVFDVALHRTYGQSNFKSIDIEPAQYSIESRMVRLLDVEFVVDAMVLKPVDRKIILVNVTDRGVRIAVPKDSTSTTELVAAYDESGQAVFLHQGLSLAFRNGIDGNVSYSATGSFSPWAIFE